jgi:hypothetical protein
MSKKQTIICKNCKKEHLVQNKYSCFNLYCSQKCQHDYNRKEKIRLWLDEGANLDHRRIKEYLIDTRGNKCYNCEITEWNNKSIVMDLEHIDGNSENNHIDNLALICPNCHSQTNTYKNRNKGKGRHSRRVRYAQGKSY